MHHYGGEYTCLFGEISKYLRKLRDCDVNAIFVFGGPYTCQVSSQMSENNHDRGMESTLLVNYVSSVEALSLT